MSAVRLAARAVVVSALGFTLVPVLGASPAYACSCIQSNEQENFERADVVFKGTMDDALRTNDQFGERIFILTPSTTYKGTTTKPQKVSTAGNSAACGVDLTGGGPFLVFAHKSEDADAKAPLSTSLCSGTREIGADEKPDFKPSKNVILTDEGSTEPTPADMTEAEKERAQAGGSGGGSDPQTPPCCKPMVGPDQPVSPPDAEPVTDPAPDEVPLGMPVDGDAVETPLMQTTAVASDSAASGESLNAAKSDGDAAWMPLAATAALLAAVAAGTGWAVRRRNA